MIRKLFASAMVITAIQLLVNCVIASVEVTSSSRTPPDETANPHYSGQRCDLCHIRGVGENGAANLMHQGRYDQLCKCHTQDTDTVAHPIDLEPPEGTESFFEGRAALQDGIITCNACHEISLHHEQNNHQGNSGSAMTYSLKTQACFQCHDNDYYETYSPHAEQVDHEGNIRAENCYYCHAELPDRETSSLKDLKFVAGLEELCLRCHRVGQSHPSSADHRIIPSPAGLNKIRKINLKFDVVLPLEKSGRITCVTCHNPHQEGVLPRDNQAAKGADSPRRQRIPGAICMECHEV